MNTRNMNIIAKGYGEAFKTMDDGYKKREGKRLVPEYKMDTFDGKVQAHSIEYRVCH